MLHYIVIIGGVPVAGREPHESASSPAPDSSGENTVLQAGTWSWAAPTARSLSQPSAATSRSQNRGRSEGTSGEHPVQLPAQAGSLQHVAQESIQGSFELGSPELSPMLQMPRAEQRGGELLLAHGQPLVNCWSTRTPSTFWATKAHCWLTTTYRPPACPGPTLQGCNRQAAPCLGKRTRGPTPVGQSSPSITGDTQCISRWVKAPHG